MKNNKGITLIALVITIIVMLILVGVTISMAVNGGLFNYAGNAVGDTRNAINDEQALTNTDIIDYYVNRKPAVTSLKAYSTALLNDKGVLDENTKYESGYNIAVIPKGFKVSDVAEEQTIAGGLVIEDAEGNQFVWIPVKTGEFERASWFTNEPVGDITLDEALEILDEEILKNMIANYFGFNSIDEMIVAMGCSNYDELLELAEAQYGVDNTKDMFKLLYSEFWTGTSLEGLNEDISTDPTGEYDNMVASVNKYGGFYIGRYEAGSEENRYENGTRTPGTTTLGVKKGLYPYDFVAWGTSMTEYEEVYAGTNATYGTYDFGYGAVYLSYNMYANEETYGVTSTLCYGVQWDATLRFIRDEKNVTDSATWGNYYESEFDFTGKYSSDSGKTWAEDRTTKPENENWYLTTGASEANKAKNIYDLAGNVYEWTMEVQLDNNRVLRGGSNNGEDAWPAKDRATQSTTYCSDGVGFRPALYIK